MNPHRRTAVAACRRLLEREGFEVLDTPSERDDAEPDLLAKVGPRRISVGVVTDDDGDSEVTQARIRKVVDLVETRVYVPRILRWRMLTNLERWGLAASPVLTY